MTIFLTGATGFLGGQLLNILLQHTDHTLCILYRDQDKAEQLVTQFPKVQRERIRLLHGDITQPNCGLTDNKFNSLRGNVKIFYHLAALVKFDEELRDELFEINLKGTEHALELAKELGVAKFFYASTAYTVGKREMGIEELYPMDGNVHNPYEESKVASEHLVLSYADQMDVSIFRPAIIVGDSETGEADSEFTLYGFMRALDVFKRRVERTATNEHTVYRVLGSKEATSNFVPVNYVAEILALAEKKAEPGKIYNITNPKPATNFEILSLIKEALDFERLEILENDKGAALTPEEEKLNEMIYVFNDYLSRSFQFDDQNTQQYIEGTHVKHLDMPRETTKMIIDAYFRV